MIDIEEHKIGETVEVFGKLYEVEVEIYGCQGCAFDNGSLRVTKECLAVGLCSRGTRRDGKGIIFVKKEGGQND